MPSLSLPVVVTLVLVTFVGFALGYIIARGRTALDVKRARKDSLARGRATIRGQVAEQLAPLVPEFDFEPADARFLGAPIDYVVFDGLTEPNRELSVVLVEVKTGKARLSANEKRVREAVDAGRVRFEVVRIAS